MKIKKYLKPCFAAPFPSKKTPVLKDRRHSPLWAECVCVGSVFVAHVCGERVCGESVFCGDDADGDATPVTQKQSTHLGRGVI